MPEVDVAIVPSVVPVGRLRERTIAWLDRAFVRGIATQRPAELSRTDEEVSVPRRRGRVHRLGRRADVTLDYYPGFAPVTDATGTRQLPQRLDRGATFRRGELGGLKVSQATFRDGGLQGAGAGGRRQGERRPAEGAGLSCRRVRSARCVGDVFMGLRATGPRATTCSLTLPAISDGGARGACRAAAATRLHRAGDARGRQPSRCPHCARPRSGSAARSSCTITTIKIAGAARHDPRRPVRTERNPWPSRPRGRSRARHDAAGRAGGAKLPAFIGLPATIRMAAQRTGSCVARIEKRRVGGDWPMQFDVTSNLSGLEIHAPRPFAKARGRDAPDARAPRDPGLARQRRHARVRQRARENCASPPATASGDSSAAPRASTAQPVALPNAARTAGDRRLAAVRPRRVARSRCRHGGRRADRRPALMDWLGPVDVHLDRATVFGFELTRRGRAAAR